MKTDAILGLLKTVFRGKRKTATLKPPSLPEADTSAQPSLPKDSPNVVEKHLPDIFGTEGKADLVNDTIVQTPIGVGSPEHAQHISEREPQIADESLVNQLRSRGVKLDKIGIGALGLTTTSLWSLRSRNITTIEHLCHCAYKDLCSLRSVGKLKARQIQERLNEFLHLMLTNAPPFQAGDEEQVSATSLRDVSELGPQVAEESLVAQIISRGVKLDEIGIEELGLPAAVLGSLRGRNVTTIEQLCHCTYKDLLSLRFVGSFKARQIQKRLNEFLHLVLADAPQSPLSEKEQSPPVASLLTELTDLAQHLCSRFKDQVPLSDIRLPVKVRSDIQQILGIAPETLADIKRDLVQDKVPSYAVNTKNTQTEKHLIFQRVVDWFKFSLGFQCIDDEVNYIIGCLNEREHLILISRCKLHDPLTLEQVGKQLGITRERVRQIQQKVQRKLVAKINPSVLLYSDTALWILGVLRAQKDNAILTTWTKQLVDIGFLKNSNSLEILIAVAVATNSSKLALLQEFTQPLETNVPQHVLANKKPVLEKASKMCRNCGAVRVLSLVNEKAPKEDVEQILRLSGYEEVDNGWWTRDVGECVAERVATKVIIYCGPVSPSSMRYALRRHLSRFQLPAPPSELLTKLLGQRGLFTFKDGLIQLTNSLVEKPNLTGPEEVFLNMVLSDGPIVSFEAVHHKLLESGYSPGSVTALLRYSPVVQKITFALYSLLGAKYNERDIQESQSQLTRIPANSTLRMRSNGVIEFETNASTWLEYGGVLASGPATSLKGDWKLITNSTGSGRLVVGGNFIRGLSQVSKDLGITSGDRIRIDFNTWTREAKMTKVVRNE